jgi:capsular polysaccharide biosynthesis protein
MRNNEMYEEEISLVDIIKFFLRNKNTIFVCFLISLFVGIIFALLQKKNYVAEAGIYVVSRKPEVTFEPKIQDRDVFEEKYYEERKKTINEIIKSPVVLNEVLSKAEQEGVIKKGEIKIQDLINEKSKIIDVVTAGSIVKVRVSLPDKYQAKFFADEIVKTTVEKSSFLIEKIQKENVDEELKNVRQKYNEAVAKYQQFVNNNKILELTTKIEQLNKMYSYYKDNITEIEKYLWQAKNLKEQVETGSITSIGEFADMLAILKFKSSIFAGQSELPLKLEVSQVGTQKIDRTNVAEVVKEIESIISILEKRKKDFEEELKTKNYEQQIRQLQAELEKEKTKQKELLNNRDLLWETLISLERKKEELNIKNGIKEEIAKVAYLSILPDYPQSGNRRIIVVLFCCLGLFLGIIISVLKEAYDKIKSL